jgi:hypothetical protein
VTATVLNSAPQYSDRVHFPRPRYGAGHTGSSAPGITYTATCVLNTCNCAFIVSNRKGSLCWHWTEILTTHNLFLPQRDCSVQLSDTPYVLVLNMHACSHPSFQRKMGEKRWWHQLVFGGGVLLWLSLHMACLFFPSRAHVLSRSCFQ